MRTSLCVRASLLLVTTALLGGHVHASQADMLGTQMAAMAGNALTRAECEQRMQSLSGLLERAGYSSMRTVTYTDGTLLARWYQAGSHQTVLVFSGQKATGNAFRGSEYAGLVRLNEFLGER